MKMINNIELHFGYSCVGSAVQYVEFSRTVAARVYVTIRRTPGAAGTSIPTDVAGWK